MHCASCVRFATAILLLFGAHECSGRDWPSIITKLERAGRQQRQAQLPTAYNNYAIELSKQGKWQEAERTLEKAITLDSGNERFKNNLANIYLEHAFLLHRGRQGSGHSMHREAKRLAEKALQKNRNLPDAHVLIGDIAYANQQLEQAKLAWTRAKRLRPGLAYVDDRLAKLDREYQVERNFHRDTQGYFDIRFQEAIDPATAGQLQHWLREARTTVGNSFRYWPRHKTVVLVYSPQAFRQIRRGPDWVAGIYDGKIRLPVPDHHSNARDLQSTLVHEYTHAIVHDLASGRCPVWLNEGLAEYQEARIRPPDLGLLRTATRLERLLPLPQLDAAFKQADPQVAGLAYQEAYSLVHYLAASRGFYRLGQLLQQLGSGTGFNEAVLSELQMSTAQLEHRWKRWLPEFVR